MNHISQLLSAYQTSMYQDSTNPLPYHDQYVVGFQVPFSDKQEVTGNQIDYQYLHIFNSATKCIGRGFSMNRFFAQSKVSQYNMTLSIQHNVFWF